jgi:hypothetical protein
LDIGPRISGFDVEQAVHAPECEKVFDNGIIRVIPKERLGLGEYDLSIKVKDGASPPNETQIDLRLEIGGGLLESILHFGTVPIILLAAALATFFYCAWNIIRLWREVHLNGRRS